MIVLTSLSLLRNVMSTPSEPVVFVVGEHEAANYERLAEESPTIGRLWMMMQAVTAIGLQAALVSKW